MTTRVLGYIHEHAAAAIGVILPIVITLVLIPARHWLNPLSHAQIYLIAVAAAAGLGGFYPAAFTVLWSAVLADFYFLPPLHAMNFPPSLDQIALIITGLLISGIITASRPRPAPQHAPVPSVAGETVEPGLTADDHILAIVTATAMRPVRRLVGWTLCGTYIDDEAKLRRVLDYPDTQDLTVTEAHLTDAHNQLSA